MSKVPCKSWLPHLALLALAAPSDYPRLALPASSSTLSFGLFLLDELVSYSVQSSGGTDEGRKAEREREGGRKGGRGKKEIRRGI